MALRKKNAPQVEPELLETVWPGDDAVDLENPKTDLAAYCRSAGDPSHLAIRPGMTPAKISYRALTPREVRAISGAIRCAADEAFRIGVVKIEGEELARYRTPEGVVGLTDACLEDLEITVEIPWLHTVNLLLGKKKTRKADLERASLPQFVGTLIQIATFLGRERH